MPASQDRIISTATAASFEAGTHWQSPHTGEWLTVTAVRPAGASLVRVHSENEQGEIVSTVLARTAHRVVAR